MRVATKDYSRVLRAGAQGHTADAAQGRGA
ncbi:hypothetical protein CBM2585_A80135 [Cupriavidus taiwanensis]|nr:hypothetical protein CBM2585_A80135 [Cupriavidus taiwanensis]